MRRLPMSMRTLPPSPCPRGTLACARLTKSRSRDFMRLVFLLSLCALCLTPEAGDGQARPAMSGIAVGFFAGINYNLPKGPEDFSGIARLGEKLGRTPAIVQGYWSWKLPDGSYRPFPMNFVDYAANL